MRISRRGAATKAAAKIKKIFQEIGTTTKPNDQTSNSLKSITSCCNKKKSRPSKYAVKSAYGTTSYVANKELRRPSDKEVIAMQRKEHEKRRVARMMHSSDKLYLSNRLTRIISLNSPKSPLECINLTSQFANSNSKIVKVTRDTRNACIHLHFKWTPIGLFEGEIISS